ncbi:MAG TPA: hypothetical protein VGO66_05970 [Solirubrobacterales bacterium]|jgi:hypothetical protein|nr:hypothetical protein [Solirubrobacterales bacterium]
MAMILLLAAPAGAATRSPEPSRAALFAVPRPAVPPRDVVVGRASVVSARISATTSAASTSDRYPIEDGSGATIAVNVTAACQESCNAADPAAIARTVGAFIHGPEVELVTVQLDTPFQLSFDCGYAAQACYFSSENRIVLSGDASLGPDGASREFVLAHEYGHHVAAHRQIPLPFPAAIDWGPEHWSSYERVCQGHRAGAFFPGDEGGHYYEDPGEAFAESFAYQRFPSDTVKWGWTPVLRPDVGAFRAIRRDTLDPWRGRSGHVLSGLVPPNGVVVRQFPTPLDGLVSIGPVGSPHLGYELILRSQAGKVLRTSRHVASRNRIDYTACGESRLRVAIRPTGGAGTPYRLTIRRP